MQPLDSLPLWSLHCTVRLCQPVSQVLEHVIHGPVTHLGPGVGVEGLGGVGVPGTTAGAAEEDVVVLIVVVLVVEDADVVVALCERMDLEINGCWGAVSRGIKKL